MHKSIYDLEQRYLHDFFIIKDRKYDYRNVLKIELSKYETVTYGKNTLQFNGAKRLILWEINLKIDLIIQNSKQCSKLDMLKNVHVIIVHIVG